MNSPEGKAWRALAGARGAGPKALWLIAGYLAKRKKPASWLLQNPEKITEIFCGSKTGFIMPERADEGHGLGTIPGKLPLTLIHPLHPDFPRRLWALKDIIPLPALLYVKGNPALLDRPAVAVVGKRNAGPAALAVADSLAGELAAQGINVISGYAAGIDSAAHAGALRAGGTTGIVLSEGISHFQIKPALRELFGEENTLVISQFEPDAKWAAFMAMTRNKLVGALSGAVAVIASGPERDSNGRNSGTFNTGISALKMGIPVFVAAPDFFRDYPAGNAELIQRGCQEWDPAAGAAPIISKMDPPGHKKPLPRQRGLFEKNED
jgi:DNA processing protein